MLRFDMKGFADYTVSSLACKCLAVTVTILFVRAAFFSDLSGFRFEAVESSSFRLKSGYEIRSQKFLEVPQIVWGLNNQKIAFARACLTARFLNRTLLMPSLSASLFYKEVDQLEPIWFEKVFDYEKFNLLCDGFVRLSRYSDVMNRSDVIQLQKGSGRRWTAEIDLDQLKQFSNHPFDQHEVVKIIGKNPFLWHDHWPLKDYAKIFRCLVLVEEYSKEADKIIAQIKMVGEEARRKTENPNRFTQDPVRYIAVHMRIEKDWMIHCKKLEHKSNMSQICSSKQQIIERVGKVVNSSEPTAVYLAVADGLLEDNAIFEGWKTGLIPLDKKKLGVNAIYEKYPYLIKSAIDYEVCSRADIFFGNSFSTFSSLVVLGRTQRLLEKGLSSLCSRDVTRISYAYNILGEDGGPQKWATNMSDTSLQAVSYGTNGVSCRAW